MATTPGIGPTSARSHLNSRGPMSSRQVLSRGSLRSMGSEAAAAAVREFAESVDDGGEGEKLLQRMASEEDEPERDQSYTEEQETKDRQTIEEALLVPQRTTRVATSFGGIEDSTAESIAYTGTDLSMVSPNVVVHASGNGLRVFQQEDGKTIVHMWGLGHAISSVTASKTSGRIAYAERGIRPAVRVMEYPGFRLIASLRGAAELGVSSMAFSQDGTLLATLGALPDFTLSVWEVATETQIVSLEGAAAPCNCVTFDPLDSSLLCTTGCGRAAFWAIEPRETGGYMLIRSDMLSAASIRPSTAESVADWHAQELLDAVPGEIPFTRAHAWIPEHRVVCGDSTGTIHVFDAAAGKREADLSWAIPFEKPTSILSIAATRTGLMIGTNDGKILWTDPEKRVVLASVKIAPNEISSIIASKQAAIAGSRSGKLISLPITPPDQESLPIATVLEDGHSGSVTGIGVLIGRKALCSCSSDGTLRFWDSTTADTLWQSIEIHSPQTSLSCGTVSDIVAVGSSNGFVRGFAITGAIAKPRMFFCQRIHSRPITHLAFHPLQLFLAVVSEGGHLCLLDTVSPEFRPIGYIDIGAEVTDIAWTATGTQNQLFLTLSGGGIHRFTIPSTKTTNLRLSFRDLQANAMRIRWTATSLAIDPSGSSSSKQIFWTLTDDHALKKFLMPDHATDPESLEESDATQPREEVAACHEKPGRCIRLSPDGLWLASGGGDGVLQIRRSSALTRRAEMTKSGHDPSSGVNAICFSPDSRFVFTAGGRVIIKWSLPGSDQQQSKQLSQPIAEPFKGFTLEELADFADSNEEPTVLEKWQATAGNANGHSEAKAKADELRQAVLSIRATMAGIVEQNEHVSQDEQLTVEEMLVNTEERDRLRKEGASQVAALREKIREENLGRDLIHERLQTEFYDSMEDHACVVKGFKNKIEVPNYPLKKRSQIELLLQDRVVVFRRTEIAELKRAGLLIPQPTSVSGYFSGSTRIAFVEKELARQKGQQQQQQQKQQASRPTTTAGGMKEDLDDAAAEAANAIPGQQLHEKELRVLLFHPFDLNTPLRKRTQMQLLKMIVRNIRKQFNEEHSKFLDTKRSTIAFIEERNTRIKELCEELHEKSEIWQPTLDDTERPESVLEIRDSEITAKKQVQGQGSSLEATKKGTDAETESSERGLKAMMGGKLGDRANTSLLDADETSDAVADQKPEWYGQREPETEEEKKQVKEYEKRSQARKDERQKHRRALETELKKTVQQVEEAAQTFDEKLKGLQFQHLQTEQMICQEELKIVRLAAALLVQEEDAALEVELGNRVERLKRRRAKAQTAVAEARTKFEAAKAENETRLQTDRIVEKSFRRDFERAESEDTFPLLFKAFRHRKKSEHHHRHHHHRSKQQQAAQQTQVFDDSDAFAGIGSADDPGLAMLQHREEVTFDVEEESLASPPEKPAEVDDAAWERLLEVRAEKIKSEIAVKRAAADLENAKRAYQLAQQRSEMSKQQLDDALASIKEFRNKQRWDSMNLEMMFRLKQGQIEVEEAPVVTKLDDCLVIESSRVEELNTRIRALSKEKADLLEQIKAAKKVISKRKWENTGIDMQIQDIQEKTKFLQLMRVTKQLQEFLKNGGEVSQANELASLERRAEHEKKTYELKMEELKRKLAKIAADIKAKEKDTERLSHEVSMLRSSVVERNKIHQVQQIGTSQTKGTTRLERLHIREKLEATVRSQFKEIQQLRIQLETIRQQTLPTF